MEMPEPFIGGGYLGATALEFSPVKRFSQQKPGENFAIDDLLDFSNDEAIISDAFFDNIPGNSTDSSTVTVVHGCDSPVSGGENDFSGNFGSQFSGEIIVPYDDLAELEWLSNFVEDSFSTDHNLQSLALAVKSESSSSSTFQNSGATAMYVPETEFPAKARSKRSRAAPCDWSTRLVRLPSEKKPPPSKTAPSRRKDGPKTLNSDSYGRKCVHCSTEKTPQWRAGPSGPKTLCNACGVRYKSGRLVPEYRPAASPTFESTMHSNSHRRVLELRGQNQFLNQRSVFDASNGGDDFLINGDMI